MEYLSQSKVCRKFLNQYNEKLIPKLLPRLMKIAIFSLYKTYHKCLFSMQELDRYIKLFNDKKMNFELESKSDNDPPCRPCPDYLTPKLNKIQKLNMSYQPSEGLANSENEKVENDRYGNRRFYPDDEIYVNKKNNFYDENYYIPKSHSLRNIQLYQDRLKNPRFTTQEKRIYPDWWWNLNDDIDQDNYSDDNSELDHHPRGKGHFPKDFEQSLKKKSKNFERPKSYNGTKSKFPRYPEDLNPYPNINSINYDSYEDTGQYEDLNLLPNRNMVSYDNCKHESQNPKINNFTTKEENSKYYNNMAASDGFNRYFPKIMNDNKEHKINNYNIRYYSSNINDDPNYATSPNFKSSPNNLSLSDGYDRDRMQIIGNPGPRDEAPNLDLDYRYEKDINQNKLSSSQYPEIYKSFNCQQMSVNDNFYDSSDLDSKIWPKKNEKESVAISYDKNFNISESKVKRNGKIRNGLTYSLDGNQKKGHTKNTRKRKKKSPKTHNDH